jgi:large subunit ribosomal protein L29
MKYSELIELGEDALAVRVDNMERELFKLKFQHSIRQIENTSKISILKKDIARVNTAINMKQTNL